MADLGQLNSNLMSASCFELAADKRVAVTERLDISHVSDRQLAVRFRICTASPPIASISDQPGSQFADDRLSADHRQIRPLDDVFCKLLNETLFSSRRSRKDQQTAGVSIDSVDRSQVLSPLFGRKSRQIAFMPAVLRNDTQQRLVETRLTASPYGRSTGLLDMAKRHHSRWLFDNHDLIVNVPHGDISITRRRR